MVYLVGEIIVCLIAAMIIGILAGWLLRHYKSESIAVLPPVSVDHERELRVKAENQISTLQHSLINYQGEIDAAAERYTSLLRELEPLRKRVSAQDTEIESLRDELVNAQRRFDEEGARWQERIRELEAPGDPANTLNTEIKRLENRLRTESEAKENRIRELELQPPSSVSQPAARPNQLNHPLEAALAYKDREIEDLKTRIAELGSLSEAVSERDRTIQALTAEVEALQTPHADTVDRLQQRIEELESAQSADDLKQIRGIGPVLEDVLHSMGITTFKQVAEFTEDDVKRVAAALSAFPDRIIRDNWMAGAKGEYAKKYKDQ